MARIKEVRIGETTFRIHRFDPWEALRILGDLQRDLLPSLGPIIAVVFKEGKEGEPGDAADETAMIAAFRELAQKLDGKSLQGWADKLLDPDIVSFELPDRAPEKLEPRHRNLAFGDFTEVLEVMFHVLQWNFAGPLARWADHFGPALGNLKGKLSADSEKTS
ncbi:hypothetical protein RAN3_2544 [plant metagenome]|uniref:Tail assembly chaperone n=1 Tax=plant metagenome TaxID=1297885 RepID=A0A484U4H4_9ZZZZ